MDVKEAKVKGTVFLDYVRMIRLAKDKNWGKYLTKEDLDIVNAKVLPSVWYPFETFNRCGNAVFLELAGGSLQITRQFGKMNAETLFMGTYKSTLDQVMASGGGVIKFLERYAGMSPMFFNFVTVSVKKITDKKVIVRVEVKVKQEDMQIEAYFLQLMGTIERLVEMAGGKQVKVTITSKIWEGAPATEYDVAWE